MNLIELKNINIAKKPISFLEKLNKNLKTSKFEFTDGFVLEPGKVSYLDITEKKYKLYDYTEFNSIMGRTYYNVILRQLIEKNELLIDLLSSMDVIYSRSKYYFYEDIYKTFHLVSWFVKSLRYSKTIEGKFDIESLLNVFPVPFLEKSADINVNIEFVIDYINFLQEKKIIKITGFILDFTNRDLLDEIINYSFEQLVFGGDINLDKCIIIPESIDIALLNDNSISDDYKFNYILSFATNYITYDNCSNNLFVENIKCRV